MARVESTLSKGYTVDTFVFLTLIWVRALSSRCLSKPRLYSSAYARYAPRVTESTATYERSTLGAGLLQSQISHERLMLRSSHVLPPAMELSTACQLPRVSSSCV